MEQWSHKKVCDLCHAIAILIAEHITHRLALLVESWVIATLFPHPSVLFVLLYIVWRFVHIELFVIEVVCLHTHLHCRLTLEDEWLSYLVKLTLGQLEQRTVMISVYGYNSFVRIGR